MRKELGAIIAGIGIEVIFLILNVQVKEMPMLIAIVGYIVGGLLILYGVVCMFVPLKKIWEALISIRLRSPVSMKKKDIAVNPIPKWLEQIVKHDKEHLQECFKLLGIGWNYSQSSEPYIMALANMENDAVFPLKVVGIGGSFYINTTKCNLDATIEREYDFPRLNHQVIRIRQAINPDTAKMITELKDKKETFYINLNECPLLTQILEPGHEPQTVKIFIGSQFEVSHITRI